MQHIYQPSTDGHMGRFHLLNFKQYCSEELTTFHSYAQILACSGFASLLEPLPASRAFLDLSLFPHPHFYFLRSPGVPMRKTEWGAQPPNSALSILEAKLCLRVLLHSLQPSAHSFCHILAHQPSASLHILGVTEKRFTRDGSKCSRVVVQPPPFFTNR